MKQGGPLSWKLPSLGAWEETPPHPGGLTSPFITFLVLAPSLRLLYVRCEPLSDHPPALPGEISSLGT